MCVGVEVSEALAMDYTRTCLVELLLRDPHGVEGGKRGVDGATQPGGVFTLVVLDNLRAVVWWHQGVHLAPQTLRDVWKQGAATSQEDVLEEVTSDRFVTLHH